MSDFKLPEAVNTLCLPKFPGAAYRANLYVYDPSGRIDWYALIPQSFEEGRYFTIGRGVGCNITLSDGSVSSQHAYICMDDGELFLRDLKSTNGCLINRERSRGEPLQHGDVLSLGATDIRFLYSYPEAAYQLALDFERGPNAGRSVATSSSSTTIGRLNCGINLNGPEIGAQHVRIDAYAPKLLFVVNLERSCSTLLNGQQLTGIAAAQVGDLLELGEHEISLRVLKRIELEDLEPQADGTLLLTGPPLQVPPQEEEIAPNHRRSPPDPEEDVGGETLMDQPLGFISPTQPPESQKFSDVSIIETAELSTPESRWRSRVGLPSERLRMLPWSAIGILLLLLFCLPLLLLMIPISRTLELKGSLAPSLEQSLLAPQEGRLQSLSVQGGAKVKEGQELGLLLNTQASQELKRIAEQRLNFLEQAEESPQLKALIKAQVQLKKQLYLSLKAPLSGQLADHLWQPEDRVHQGELLFHVFQRERLKLSLSLPQEFLGLLESKPQAWLLPKGLPDRLPLDLGRPGDLPLEDGSFPLQITVENSAGRLRVGQQVRVEILRPEISLLSWLWQKI